MPPGEIETTEQPSKTNRKRRRVVLACTECHRRKQKCDRLQPCGGCVGRKNEASCSYVDGDPLVDSDPASQSGQLPVTPGGGSVQSDGAAPDRSREQADHDRLIRSLGYSSSQAFSTRNLVRDLQAIEDSATATSKNEALPLGSVDGSSQAFLAAVRRLPRPEHMEILVQRFFSEVAWNYDVVDETIFRSQLRVWQNVPYATLRGNLQRLPSTIRYFPALLFQALAHALLFHSPNGDSELEELRPFPGMSFRELAIEYSETGNSLLALVGKQEATMVRVQTGFMRVSFLKSRGNVVEAWHVLGTTIRDAQEMGLHVTDPDAADLEDDVLPMRDGVADDLWSLERRRKIWLVLHLFDSHMAVALSRPMATADCPIRLPAEAINATNGTTTIAPTPFLAVLLGYLTAYKYLPRIASLQNNGCRASDYYVVQEIHDSIKKNVKELPEWASSTSPDTSFDQLPGCDWILPARLTFIAEAQFVLLALHRPYIFTFPNSRREAMKSALTILDTQAQLHELLKDRSCPSFILIFSTFDAIVIASAICYKYPEENASILELVLRHISSVIERFAPTGKEASTATSAHVVITSLYKILKQRVSRFISTRTAITPQSEMTASDFDRLGYNGDFNSSSSGASTWSDKSNTYTPQPFQDFSSSEYNCEYGDLGTLFDLSPASWSAEHDIVFNMPEFNFGTDSADSRNGTVPFTLDF